MDGIRVSSVLNVCTSQISYIYYFAAKIEYAFADNKHKGKCDFQLDLLANISSIWLKSEMHL